jgi:predicted GIY-YIG superfamily endonuclease
MNLNKTCGIYYIKNIINGKIYIGSSVQIGIRWQQHKAALRENKHHCIYLQHAWK